MGKKILVLANRIPYPLNDGGNMAVYNTLEMYHELGYNVHLLSMNTSRHFIDENHLPAFFKNLSGLYLQNINNDITVFGALKALMKNESYHLSRFYDQQFSDKLINLLQVEDFDIIQLEGLFLCSYVDILKQYSHAKIIYRQHNIEYKIWEKKALEERNFFKKKYFEILARQLKKVETDFIKRADIICPISLNDMNFNHHINSKLRQFYWPYTPKHHMRDSPAVTPISIPVLKLYHIGAMDWIPNQEAVDWLLDEIFPAIEKKCPHAELFIAGRNLPERYYAYQRDNVHIVGEVEDSTEFQKDKHILIIPLKSASGQRIKFIEGMKLKKCIVSSDVGKSDIKVQDSIHYLRANSVDDFVDQILRILIDQDLYYSICHNAYSLYEKEYAFSTQKEKINSFINKL